MNFARCSVRLAIAVTSLAPLLLAGCGPGTREISIDGSSTVYPITRAIAEKYDRENPGKRISVGYSGTGGGFKKFAAGSIDICDASRPIKAGEKESLKKAGIDYIELRIAIDGLAVVVHPDNDWCDCLTVDQLQSLWKPGSNVSRWNELDAKFPKQPIKLYGPGTDSGTFDYFTEAIVGEEGASRQDYEASEDDNTLVTGVAGDKYALGYFGYAYYAENKKKVKAIGIDGGDNGNCVKPSAETVLSGEYEPLSRPLFIYVKKSALGDEEVRRFVKYYLQNAAEGAEKVKYVPVTEDVKKENLKKFEEAVSAI